MCTENKKSTGTFSFYKNHDQYGLAYKHGLLHNGFSMKAKMLRINYFGLEDAMTWNNELSEDYRCLNILTGEMHIVLEEVVRAIDNNNEDDLSDWQKDEVEITKKILNNENQFLDIPKIESRDSYRWMEGFIETIENTALAEGLNDAINRKNPFRRFKEILSEYDKENESWFRFYSDKIRNEAILWLKDNNINPCWQER